MKAVKSGIFWSSLVYLSIQNVLVYGQVEGPSMLPTFNYVGDWIAADLIQWKWYSDRNLKRFSVWIYTSPEDCEKVVLKRIIGLPGDSILVKNLNGRSSRVIVPSGHVWAQGDNLKQSNDSRHYGPVPIGLLRGPVLFKFRPFWYSFFQISVPSNNQQFEVEEFDSSQLNRRVEI